MDQTNNESRSLLNISDLHAAVIKSKGEWIPGVIDPASQQRSQTDGQRVIDGYRKAGLRIIPAKNQVTAGVNETWTLFSTGKLKIARSLKKTHAELLSYAFDENGNIIKKKDHLMDCLRYIVLNSHVAICKPRPFDSEGGAGARRYF